MNSAVVALGFALSLALGACERSDERGTPGEVARRIETELERNGVDGVEVSIHERTATLRGLVASPSERALSEAVAMRSGAPHVTRVENHVAVARPPVLTSASNEGRAAAQIEMHARSLGLQDVRVTVERGAFVIHGPVPLGTHDDLMRIAVEEAPDGYHVVDQTRVEEPRVAQ